MLFRDRKDAGRRLAAALRPLQDGDLVVLGLPRGGVPVAYEVAAALDAPLDVIVVRKLGVPWQPELAMGAVGEDGVLVRNEDVLRLARVPEGDLQAAVARERQEVARRAARWRGDRPAVRLHGRTALIVDDGIATGATARAACRVARAHGARSVVLAAPVAPPDTVAALQGEADQVVCLSQPERFGAVGQFYRAFGQTSDEEVGRLLRLAREERDDGERPPAVDVTDRRAAARDEEVGVPVVGGLLPGRLTVPPGARGVVVFAHGTGSSRTSPRNRAVARSLNALGLATLLFDLLSPHEADDRANVFDVELLGTRLLEASAWLAADGGLEGLALGWFGASTGAAAALWAAGVPDATVRAVVSRGGRPDLAGDRLRAVRAPTLLVVGGRDDVVLSLNRRAQHQLVSCENRLVVVPGATHLFDEPGALGRVARLAGDWFAAHLLAGSGVPSGPLPRTPG